MNENFLGMPLPFAIAIFTSVMALVLGAFIGPIASNMWARMFARRSKLRISTRFFDMPRGRYTRETLLDIAKSENDNEVSEAIKVVAQASYCMRVVIANKGSDIIRNMVLARVGSRGSIVIDGIDDDSKLVPMKTGKVVRIGDINPGFSTYFLLYFINMKFGDGRDIWKELRLSADQMDSVTYKHEAATVAERAVRATDLRRLGIGSAAIMFILAVGFTLLWRNYNYGLGRY